VLAKKHRRPAFVIPPRSLSEIDSGAEVPNIAGFPEGVSA
jgi:hypothetical protein